MATEPDPEVAALEARVRALEATQAGLMARLAALEGTPAAPAEPAPPPMRPGPEPPPQAPPRTDASAAPPAEPAAGPAAGTDWEKLIGGRWAMWVGALALFLAVASFLAYTWAAIPAGARVAGGFGLGLALMASGFAARRRAEPWFGEGLAGAGLALLYLNVWSAHTHHMLVGTAPTFAGLLAVTALGAWLAVRHQVTSLIALATAGGFLAPLVIGDAGGPLQRMAYALVLDGGLLAISLHRRWPGLAWGCLLGTLALWPHGLAGDVAGWHLAGLTAAFALFLGSAVGGGLRAGGRTHPADLLLLLAAAFLYAPAASEPVSVYLPGHEGLFPAALALLFAGLGQAVRRKVPADAALVYGLDALAVFFLTIALPLELSRVGFVWAWCVEAALLAGLWHAFGNPVARWLSVMVGGVAAIGALVGGIFWPAVPPAFLNDRGLTQLIAAACAAGTLAFARGRGHAAGPFAAAGLVGATTAWLWVGSADLHASWPAFPAHAGPRLAAAGVALAALATYLAGARWPDPLLRRAAVAWWGLAAALLVIADPMTAGNNGTLIAASPASSPGRAIATLVVAGAAVAMARLAQRVADPAAKPATGLALAAVLLTVWGASVEAYAWLHPTDPRGAQLAVSFLWILAGVADLLAGIRLRQRAFRLLGLGLLGASVCKVFVFDLAFLDTPYRIAAFGGLGAALMGISWLYGRYGTGETAA